MAAASSISTIPTTFLNSTTDPNASDAQLRAPKTTLDQNDFLKLLVTKMQAQDPMNPQSDENFIAQMAQFSSLEQSKSMNTTMTNMNEQQDLLTANELIGRNVTLNDGTHDLGAGMVTSVVVKDGAPAVVVGGKNYGLDQITNITPYVAPTNT